MTMCTGINSQLTKIKKTQENFSNLNNQVISVHESYITNESEETNPKALPYDVSQDLKIMDDATFDMHQTF